MSSAASRPVFTIPAPEAHTNFQFDLSEPAFCSICGKPIEGEDYEKCHVCATIVCPSCDIRWKEPAKPACAKHA
jgi:hypothetical protein